MSTSIITQTAKKKMLLARAGEIVLPKVVGFAFGCGGVDSFGKVKEIPATQSSLNNELLRKEIDGYNVVSYSKVQYKCLLKSGECDGYSISEIALYDEDGDILCIKNFNAKSKDSDIEMNFTINNCYS